MPERCNGGIGCWRRVRCAVAIALCARGFSKANRPSPVGWCETAAMASGAAPRRGRALLPCLERKKPPPLCVPSPSTSIAIERSVKRRCARGEPIRFAFTWRSWGTLWWGILSTVTGLRVVKPSTPLFPLPSPLTMLSGCGCTLGVWRVFTPTPELRSRWKHHCLVALRMRRTEDHVDGVFC